MSLDQQQTDQRPLSGPDELLEYFREGERSTLLVGLEHEKLIYPVGSATPVPYEGERGIGALLAGFAPFGWSPVREGPDRPAIAMTKGQAAISLEPGGQLELSGSPQATAALAHLENLQHLAELKQVCARLGLRAVALGYRPFETVAQMPWMPKSRYGAMRRTLATHGPLALDMMLLTATGQVSLDYASEADCAKKVTLVARMSPVLVALYANSPLRQGQPSGYLSFRSRVWSEVDPSRCGYRDFMLDGGFTYARYAEWALAAPMLFLRRNGTYLTPPLSFGEFLDRGFEGERATREDWVDHLSTLFPEVRVKKLIEVRAADCNGPALTGALGALMRGLFYSPTASARALGALPALPLDEHRRFHELAQREGLEARWNGQPLAELALELIAAARAGLGELGDDEPALLEPLEAVARSGRSPARRVLEAPREPVALLDAFTL